MTSTTEALKPLSQASGGDARRFSENGHVALPRIVPVRAASVYRGDGWLGVRMRDASVVNGVGVLPLFAGLIGLLLLLGALAATWLREGDSRHAACATTRPRRLRARARGCPRSCTAPVDKPTRRCDVIL